MYNIQNPEKRDLANKRYSSKNRSILAEKAKKYYYQNKHNDDYILKRRSRVRKRKALKRLVEESYKPHDETFTRSLFGHRCFNCKTDQKLQIDHHYPLSSGFALTVDNAVLLCAFCNNSKHNKMPEEFYPKDKLQLLEYLLALATAYR
jgi:5-methylcytosine-specific restriction endonuclease McrA